MKDKMRSPHAQYASNALATGAVLCPPPRTANKRGDDLSSAAQQTEPSTIVERLVSIDAAVYGSWFTCVCRRVESGANTQTGVAWTFVR